MSSLRLHRIFGPGVRLSAVEGERRPVWIQAATVGVWKGHPSYPVVEFTEKTFDQVIANLHQNPSYLAGASGVGERTVVRCDYEHASEVGDPTRGRIPQEGLPAPGWVMDAKKVRGEDGKIQLWALVDMGDQLWGQVERKEYLWTSVAIDPNGKDRVTNQPIGAVMTSLAMTNNPFILGMEPMTTSQARAVAPTKIAATSGSLMLVDDHQRDFVLHHLAPDLEAALEGYEGLNAVEKAVCLLSQTKPGFRSLPFHEQVFQAGQFCRTGVK